MIINREKELYLSSHREKWLFKKRDNDPNKWWKVGI